MTVITTAPPPQLVLRSIDHNWDYARWEQLPDDGNRYEVLDGVLYMTTAPSNYHQWIIGGLWQFVGIPCRESGWAHPFAAPIGLLIPGCQPAQPDFLLVKRENAGIIHDGRIRGAPDLIVEVLSPSNPEMDTDTKRGIYARGGVPEYWIARPATRDVLVYWQPDLVLADFVHVRLFAAGERLISPTLPIEFAVMDLFSGAPDSSL